MGNKTNLRIRFSFGYLHTNFPKIFCRSVYLDSLLSKEKKMDSWFREWSQIDFIKSMEMSSTCLTVNQNWDQTTGSPSWIRNKKENLITTDLSHLFLTHCFHFLPLFFPPDRFEVSVTFNLNYFYWFPCFFQSKKSFLKYDLNHFSSGFISFSL